MKSKHIQVSLNDARWALAKIWFIGGGAIFLFLIVQTLGTIYGDSYGEVWSWALPNVMPTLSLIMTVLGAAAITHGGENPIWVKRKYLTLAKTFSICYLALIFLSIVGAYFAAHFRPSSKFTEVDAIKMSGIWLAPIQALVVACIGALFFTEQAREGTKKVS